MYVLCHIVFVAQLLKAVHNDVLSDSTVLEILGL